MVVVYARLFVCRLRCMFLVDAVCLMRADFICFARRCLDLFCFVVAGFV